jgi:hypothetical protein
MPTILYSTHTIAELALIARDDWGEKVNFAASPYLDAMTTLTDIDDRFGADPGRRIVAYFLTNASSWRGDTARSIKAELTRRLKAR